MSQTVPDFNSGHPLFLLGATASGKSDLALEWARAAQKAGHEPVILSMDSMQIYRGADIGTGKTTPEEQAEFPHGGLDLVNVGEDYDVAQYCTYAANFLAQHQSKLVFIVGGTGLYFRALTQGLCEAPATPPELREELNAISDEDRLARLRAEDPAICEHLDLQNPRRVQRALEVILATGTSLLDWQRQPHTPPVVPQFRAFVLQREREQLRERISQRVANMFAAGWIEETAALIQAHGAQALLKFSALGYRNNATALTEVGGDPNAFSTAQRAALIEKVTQLTHQYARRQLTWFRREPTLNTWLAT